MAKLVVLNEGLTGQSFELNTEKTTIGRVDDNSFQIAVGSVSSHHAEIYLRGSEVVVKDLASTNGTFVNGQQVTTEAVLKPGQTLRLGQVEIRLENGAAPASGAPASTPEPVAPIKKPLASTMVISKGVSLEQLEQGPHGFDTTRGEFKKKQNKTNLYFIIGGIVFFLVIGVLILYILSTLNKSPGQ
jgi:pSer/pThr/pTyr-binding forkhead associated (FHA) protein